MTNGLPETPDSLTGGCMCGAVRYRISEKPIAAALCHCNRCRPQAKLHGGVLRAPPNAWLTLPAPIWRTMDCWDIPIGTPDSAFSTTLRSSDSIRQSWILRPFTQRRQFGTGTQDP